MEDLDTAQLLGLAADGDQGAWDALVERYARLVWSVLATFRLGTASREDIYQTVWLRLVEHLGRITQPDRLAGWLATTARNEALRVQRLHQRMVPVEDVGLRSDQTAPTPEEHAEDAAERAALVAAWSRLSAACQELLRLLTLQPPLDYATIGELLGRPVGSLGPTRARCLQKLRLALEAP